MKTLMLISLLFSLTLSGCICAKQNEPVAADPKQLSVVAAVEKKEPNIIETKILADGAVQITWYSVKGSKYEVLSTTSTDVKKAEWKAEATVDAADGDKTSWTDTKAGSSPAKLYRIRKVEPPK